MGLLKNRYGLMFLVVMGVMFSAYAVADEKQNGTQPAEVEKVQVAQKRLSQEEQLARALEKVNAAEWEPFIIHDEPLCNAFLQDFKEQKGIEYIQPIIETGNYDDSRFEPYKKRCADPAFEWNRTIAFQPRLFDYAKDLPLERRMKIGDVSLLTENFKLYQVDITNTSSDGEELVFYGERKINQKTRKYISSQDGMYRAYGSIGCDGKGIMAVGNLYDYVQNTPTDNFHAVIKYRSKYYIVYYDDSAYGRLKLTEYLSKYVSLENICIFKNKRR